LTIRGAWAACLVVGVGCGSASGDGSDGSNDTDDLAVRLAEVEAAHDASVADLQLRLGAAEARLEALEALTVAHDDELAGVDAELSAQATALAESLDAVCAHAERTGECWALAPCADQGACSTRRVFVTSTAYDGSLSTNAAADPEDGLARGDLRCQEHADLAGLGGSWSAWLAGAGVEASTPRTRFATYAGPYVGLDGTVVATSRADLLDGSLAAPLHLDETGQVVSGPAWSGVTAQGHAAASEIYETCGDWTAQSSWAWFGYLPPYEGMQGVIGATDAAWTDAGVSELCFELAHLYCFEQ